MKPRRECSGKTQTVAVIPCAGPLWESKKYYVNGTSDFRCKAHAMQSHAMHLNGGPRYVPIPMRLKKGMKVRFTMDNLGASEKDELSRVTGERPNVGDTGTVSFLHPNHTCRGWWYVEWTAPSGRVLYVGVLSSMVEAVL